jgi:signal transduction histidine kinase/HPt (histidine-containing phosphotransfer) domain-containing protein
MDTTTTAGTANILVVDDERHTLQALEALLAGPDRKIITAASGSEALRWILKSDFALIMLDVRMPGMNGFEVATMLRKLKRSRHTPIMFLTGAAERSEWVAKGYEVGAVDYVVKPVEPEVLKSKVAAFVSLNSKSAKLATQVVLHRTAERELFKAKGDLELKIRDRTSSLITAHDRLRKEVEMRQLADAELTKAKQAAEAANRAKSDFLAHMSHEIRTPMNAIIGLTQMALQTELNAEQREYLDLIHSSGESLLGLVNDVLDISKIEAGQLAVEAVPFSLRDCIGEAITILAFEANIKGLDLSWEVASETPDLLLGDPVRLRQILLNIAGNAIKFTEQGSVSISVRLESASEAEVGCYFTVRDTGIGIPLDKQEAIFSPFRQADASTTRYYGGTGLGLTIAARLVQLMHGRIWLDSTPGKGSTFHFEVHLGRSEVAHSGAAGSDSAATADAPTSARGETRKLCVLLVEDNFVNRRLAQIVLGKQGHTIVAVESGGGALEALRQQRFDLVLMDVQMPGMDGIETTRAVRRMEKSLGGHVPILALTANAIAGDRERCLQAGMDGYLVKPIRPVALIDAVERLEHHTNDPGRVRAADRRGVSAAQLMELVGGDANLLGEVSGLFVRESAKQLAALKATIDAGDAERYGRALHTIRGMLRNFAAGTAEQAAAGMETLDPGKDKTEAYAAWEVLSQSVNDLKQRLLEVVTAAKTPAAEWSPPTVAKGDVTQRGAI